MNQTAEYVAKRFQRPTLAIDPLDGFEESFLDGKHIKTVGHYRTPPSVHARIQMYKHVPELTESIAWLNVWNDQHLAELRAYHKYLVSDSIIIAEFQTLKSLGEEAGLGYIPLYHHGDRFAVRVIMS